MLCYSLKTLNKLKKVKEIERQLEKERVTTKAATKLFASLQIAFR
jgi:hypothetical protein